jgi:cytochrome b561/polyisoprenoid-binding protein YceI
MALANTADSYGSVARTLHWLTALLILTAIPLGVIANGLAYATAEALAFKAQLFSLHKTVGVAAFLIALARILWALTQPHPAPLHPDRRAEVLAASVVHWALYLSLLLVPLTGWVHHAATTGFAPLLWPFGQGLPFVPQSEIIAGLAGNLHWVFTKLLLVAIAMHIAGALKHHLIDRDATLRRMTSGIAAGGAGRPQNRRGPLLAALAIYAAGAGLAVATLPTAETPTTPSLQAVASDWTVTEGTLEIGVQQMGQSVSGTFAVWTAAISFDETPTNGRHGEVTVTIATDSLTLGSVTAQAVTPEFLDVAAFPTATFAATILPAATGFLADGTLMLRGVPVPVSFPFTLTLRHGIATMKGTATLDRRDFGIGPSYPDEKSVAFPVSVTVRLTATRAQANE